MKKPTQKVKILEHLAKSRTLSGLEAFALYRVVDLPKRMSDLINKDLLKVEKELKVDETGHRYMRYSIKASEVPYVKTLLAKIHGHPVNENLKRAA